MHTGFLTIYWRDMLRFVRFKTLLFTSLVQPALWLAFFGIAMSNNFERLTATLPATPGVRTIGYLTFIGAGVIAMTTLFTSLFGGTVLLFDKNWGLMRETLSSPLPRIHVIIGIGLSGMTKSFIQAAVIMGFGLLLGFDFFGGYTPFQIIYSLDGEGHLDYRGMSFKVKAGEIFIINCMEHHIYYTPRGKTWDTLWVHFYGENALSLDLDGTECYSITGLATNLEPHKVVDVKATHPSGRVVRFKAVARLDSDIEIEYYKHGGILQYVLRGYLL